MHTKTGFWWTPLETPVDEHTVWIRFNAVNFLQNIHERHRLAELRNGAPFRVQLLIDILPKFLQWCVQYHATFHNNWDVQLHCWKRTHNMWWPHHVALKACIISRDLIVYFQLFQPIKSSLLFVFCRWRWMYGVNGIVGAGRACKARVSVDPIMTLHGRFPQMHTSSSAYNRLTCWDPQKMPLCRRHLEIVFFSYFILQLICTKINNYPNDIFRHLLSITWTDVDQDIRRHMASSGLNQYLYHRSFSHKTLQKV